MQSADTPQKAVVIEAHRVSAVITTRLIRIAPNETLRYKDWEIPAGVSPMLKASAQTRGPLYRSHFAVAGTSEPSTRSLSLRAHFKGNDAAASIPRRKIEPNSASRNERVLCSTSRSRPRTFLLISCTDRCVKPTLIFCFKLPDTNKHDIPLHAPGPAPLPLALQIRPGPLAARRGARRAT